MAERAELIGDTMSMVLYGNYELSQKYDLKFSYLLTLQLEVICELLRAKAPMEFDDYLRAFAEELPNGKDLDANKVLDCKAEMMDIIDLVMS